MGDQNALFAQYEAEYCTSSTNVARKIQGLSIIAGGTLLSPSPPRPCTRRTPARWYLRKASLHSGVSLANRTATSQRTGGRERLERGGPNRALSAFDARCLQRCVVRGGDHMMMMAAARAADQADGDGGPQLLGRPRPVAPGESQGVQGRPGSAAHGVQKGTALRGCFAAACCGTCQHQTPSVG